MVIDVGAAIAGDVDAVRSEIAAVRAAVPGAVLKVIVESAALLTLADEQLLIDVCRAAEDAHADFVKTSTGFHPAGGASIAAVALMADTVGGRLGVKASGGIRTCRRCAGDAQTPAPPGWGCRAPARSSTAWTELEVAETGSWLPPAGMVALLVENAPTTPALVTCTLSAWMPSG